MKKILLIHQSAELYGSDKTILMFITNLDRNKYLPIVILPFDGPLKREFEKNNVEVIIAPVLKLYRKMFTPKGIVKFFNEYKLGLKILSELHKKYSFDIVYSHTLASLIGIVFARKNKIKHLWHVQEIIAKPVIFNKGFVKLLSLKANNIAVYDSKTTMEFWIKDNPSLEKKSEFVCNGLDVSSKPPLDLELVKKIRKEYFKVEENDLVISLVGRINSWKGQPLLLEAFNILSKKYDNIKLVFIGSAPPNQEFFETRLRLKISEYKLEDRVEIIPFQENIWPFWDAIDIAVVPSTEPEPFGMVAIEAMLSKKPVVAANHGGLTETVVHEYNGLLFKPGIAENLSECLKTLIDDNNLRTTFGENGYNRTIEHFSLAKHLEKFDTIFEKI
jgi:glycosyltransferase involved in cell wall biosynthesis